MNRRHFLSAVSAAVGALVLDPERLLWVPGQRTYFDIVRPNTMLTPEWVTMEALGLFNPRSDLLRVFTGGWSGGLAPAGSVRVRGNWVPN